MKKVEGAKDALKANTDISENIAKFYRENEEYLEEWEKLKTFVFFKNPSVSPYYEILRMMLNDIGMIGLSILMYDLLPVTEVPEDHASYGIYIELQDKNHKSLRAIKRRLKQIEKLKSHKLELRSNYVKKNS